MLGQAIPMWTPHQVQALVSSMGTGWLSSRSLLQVRLCFFGKKKKKIISFELIYLQGSNGDTDIEKRLTDTTGREGEGGTNRESRMETYTLPYVKQIVNGNLLHDSGNSKEAMLLGNPLATRKACHLFPTETGPLEHDSTDTIQSPLT